MDLNDISKIATAIEKFTGGSNDTGGDFGWKADSIRPRKRPIRNPNTVWTGKIVLGLDRPSTTYYTTVKCWAIRPTKDFPRTTFRIGMSNGKSNVFHTVSADEIGQLMGFFEQMYKKSIETQKEYAPYEAKMLELEAATDEMYRNIIMEEKPKELEDEPNGLSSTILESDSQ